MFCFSLLQMTWLVLPGMVERSKGAILNISSASGMYPVPLLTMYSATKVSSAFEMKRMIRNYSVKWCLHEEYKSKGIFVQQLLLSWQRKKITFL
eukprot:bmy_10489T0